MSMGYPIAFSSEVDTGSRQEKRVKARIESPVLIQSEPKKGARFPDGLEDFFLRFCAGPDIQEAFSASRIGSETSFPIPETRSADATCGMSSH
jgi:hypothetical protein